MNLTVCMACFALMSPAPELPAPPEPLMTLKGKPLFADEFAAPPIDPKWVRPYGAWAIVEQTLQGSQRQADGHNANCKMAFGFTDAVLQFHLRFDGAGQLSFALDSAKGHVGRLTVAPHGFTLQKDASSTDPNDPRRVLDTTAFAFEPGRWYALTVECLDGELLARVDDGHFVLGADPKFERAKTRIAFGVHGQSIRLDNVRAFAATPNPGWAATKARLLTRHAAAPSPAIVGPDHFKNAQNQKKRKAQPPAVSPPAH